jgi:hypothetical protein
MLVVLISVRAVTLSAVRLRAVLVFRLALSGVGMALQRLRRRPRSARRKLVGKLFMMPTLEAIVRDIELAASASSTRA